MVRGGQAESGRQGWDPAPVLDPSPFLWDALFCSTLLPVVIQIQADTLVIT